MTADRPRSHRLPQSAKLFVMQQRIAAILCLIVVGLALGGCTKCGFIWQDSGRACHSDTTR